MLPAQPHHHHQDYRFQVFVDLLDVKLDQVLTGTQDLGRGSIIQIEDELAGIGKHGLKIEDIANRCPGETE
jgi:hypothetical protein